MSKEPTKVRVIESTGSWYKILLPNQQIVDARIPGKFRLSGKEVTNPVAVGDWVNLNPVDDGTYIISHIYERENAVVRTATHGKKGKQIICANVDTAFIVQSVKQPEYNLGLIDRFLVATSLYENANPAILINKMDLAGKAELEFMQEWIPVYEKMGYQVELVSANDDTSIQQFKENIKGKTISFTGPSGVGKTSILNKIFPDLNLKTQEISSWSNKGKHTTTFARLIPVSDGTFIVDTPGIREFGIAEIEPEELALLFPDFEAYRAGCKYYNCLHLNEPGCEVQGAVQSENIYSARYKSYLSILNELQSKKPEY